MGVLSHFLSSREELSLKHPKQSLAARVEDDLKEGLQTLIIHPSRARRIVHSCTVSTAWQSPPPPPPLSMFRSRVMDDVIGTESGDYMSSNVEDLEGVVDKAEPHRNSTRSRSRSTKTREFPPPIPLLTQTGGMTWFFKKKNIDGRLIMRAKRMKRRECFEAHRLNGRLTMKLVSPVDDTVYCEDCGGLITEVLEELEDDEDMAADGSDEQVELESECSWLQKSPMKRKKETGEESEELRKCIGYDDGLVQDLDPFWNRRGIERPSPGSTSLRPMTAVM